MYLFLLQFHGCQLPKTAPCNRRRQLLISGPFSLLAAQIFQTDYNWMDRLPSSENHQIDPVTATSRNTPRNGQLFQDHYSSYPLRISKPV